MPADESVTTLLTEPHVGQNVLWFSFSGVSLWLTSRAEGHCGSLHLRRRWRRPRAQSCLWCHFTEQRQQKTKEKLPGRLRGSESVVHMLLWLCGVAALPRYSPDRLSGEDFLPAAMIRRHEREGEIWVFDKTQDEEEEVKLPVILVLYDRSEEGLII